ncbi:sulfurtransferase [Microbacterium indicum]|uniref:sulfurtransferase n=1 Tax=Microbacterium indicum TaxID=358100 RepID=UPI0004279A6C|nr:sulfurtransferase [Microbacterium indicum]
MTEILIEPDELADRLAGDRPPRVLDVRWRLERTDGREAFAEGHIPGAVYVDLETELAEAGSPAADGRHPLPSRERLEAAARRWGISDGDSVVVYDALRSLSASRAWWLLRDAGIADVRILDGALRGWISAGHDVETGESSPEPGDVTLGRGGLAVVDIDGAARVAADGVLLDVRAAERYRGETEPIDPRAGHVPGAVSLPTVDSTTPDGRFLPADELRERFAAAGVTEGAPVAVYCGSGVTASHAFAALTLAGYAPILFPGSWSQWSNHPELPVATGPTPEGASPAASPEAAA